MRSLTACRAAPSASTPPGARSSPSRADVQDPGNIGAIVRVAEAAGATGLVAAGACADPFGWKALRGSMGSALRLPVVTRESDGGRRGRGAAARLPHRRRACRATGARCSTSISAARSPCSSAARVRASRRRSIDAADERVTIPMQPPVESLNVAVTAALLLYEARRQRARPRLSRPEHLALAMDSVPRRASRSVRPPRRRPSPSGCVRARSTNSSGRTNCSRPGKPLRQAIERDLLQSIILWGPPGTGKTTLARIIADTTKARFVSFSAVLAGIKEIRDVMSEAERLRRATGRRTIVFIDEIHRFNKAQQDAFLPRVEAGDIVLIGATTENPSFEVNAALLSRSKVFVLRGLDDRRSGRHPAARARRSGCAGSARERPRSTTTRSARLRVYANGDARVGAQPARAERRPPRPSSTAGAAWTPRAVEQAIQRRALLYDKSGEEHYNLISALHKSMRNSDPDAAVYWLARMVEAGEDPLYIARRLVRFASEDIGNADPQALTVAVAAKEAVHFIGMPEGNTALAQAAIYLATAPKSNAVYEAYSRAADDAGRTSPSRCRCTCATRRRS